MAQQVIHPNQHNISTNSPNNSNNNNNKTNKNKYNNRELLGSNNNNISNMECGDGEDGGKNDGYLYGISENNDQCVYVDVCSASVCVSPTLGFCGTGTGSPTTEYTEDPYQQVGFYSGTTTCSDTKADGALKHADMSLDCYFDTLTDSYGCTSARDSDGGGEQTNTDIDSIDDDIHMFFNEDDFELMEW